MYKKLDNCYAFMLFLPKFNSPSNYLHVEIFLILFEYVLFTKMFVIKLLSLLSLCLKYKLDRNTLQTFSYYVELGR